MKLKLLIASMAMLTLAACGGDKGEDQVSAEPILESVEQRLSYMVGSNMAKQFKRDDVVIDIDALKLGIDDLMADKESRLSEELIQETIATLQARGQKRQEEEQLAGQKEQEEALEKNKTEGAAYLATNGAKEGVVSTESGLQYKELVAGDGEKPEYSDTVSVHYKGMLTDGTVFDSSYDRNEPATFPVAGVIPGWIEALQLMDVGDKWELTIPSDLAYGENGAGASIGPNSTLVFEVELLDVTKSEKLDVSK
ncbi:MAG: FKBP-type peptidyl-prolyl cis-trans isomerase FklB [Cellvibrionaceae bacterium]|jgi:FKBP-type peptidyl-prolyl cis-trans isomerase FklB